VELVAAIAAGALFSGLIIGKTITPVLIRTALLGERIRAG
jgi:hypothetical protein